VTLDGGVRWNWEHKDFAIQRELFIDRRQCRAAQSGLPDETVARTRTGNLTLTYRFNQEVSAFAKYSRGFKAGHFNALASENVNRPPPIPHVQRRLEAGLAGAWFDRRLSASLSYFYYRYKDYQIFLFRSVAGRAAQCSSDQRAPRPRTTASSSRRTRSRCDGILPRMFENLLLDRERWMAARASSSTSRSAARRSSARTCSR
jgi:outer membrane receptor protein involved in Fe transport